jgi:hypothetical protein
VQWAAELPAGKQVVVACVHGHEASQTAATALRAPASMRATSMAVSRGGSKRDIRISARRPATMAQHQRPGSRGRGRRSTALPAPG